MPDSDDDWVDDVVSEADAEEVGVVLPDPDGVCDIVRVDVGVEDVVDVSVLDEVAVPEFD